MWYCPTDVMWADVLAKPLQGQKFRDMCAFLQNCPRDYDYIAVQQTFELAWKLMNQQVQTVASLWECVDGHINLPKRGDKTGVYAVSLGWTRQVSIQYLANTSAKGIQKKDHVNKPHGQKV
jgi:hypothetical protein